MVEKRITIWLVAINVLAFVMQLVIPSFTETFSLIPSMALNGYYWQFVTYMFLHAPGSSAAFLSFHLFLNMFVLLMFGPVVEQELGKKRFLTLYLVAGIFSACFHMLLTGDNRLMLGASGAIFSLLTAYGILFPKNWVWFIIPMPARIAVFVFAGMELFLGLINPESSIANFGHLGGIVAGLIMVGLWKYFDRKTRKNPGFEFIWE